MTVDEQGRELLELARRGLDPSAADTTRVRQRLFAAITFAGAVSSPADAGASSAPTELGLGAGVRASTVIAKLAIAGAVVVAGGLGYAAGHHRGVHDERARATSQPTAALAPSAGTTASRTNAPITAEPAAGEPAGTAAVAPIGKGASRQATKDLPDSASSTTPTPSTRAELDEELIQMRRVERALRDGNPRLALALLGDLERAVPRGRLNEERYAAEVMAKCGLGVGPPVVLADDFAKKYASSVYYARVMQACREAADER